MSNRLFPLHTNCRQAAVILLLLASVPDNCCGDESVATAFPLDDASVAEALLRLPEFDLRSRPDLLNNLDRYLKKNRGTTRYFQLVRQFDLQERSDELLELALARQGTTPGAWAAETLVSFGQRDRLERGVKSEDKDRSVAAIRALANVGDTQAQTFLQQTLFQTELSPEALAATATALAGWPQGERFLAETVAAGKLPPRLHFTVANLLHASAQQNHREIAIRFLPLPATKGGAPLPPLHRLVKRSGDAAKGRELFFSKAECGNCHRVAEAGKAVGPELTGIGDKLARQALYTAILDPSAGISHNYENHELVTLDGKIETGILLSQGDERIELKNAEGIVRSFPAAEVESLRPLQTSLMPAGIEEKLTAEELIDLVEYLSRLKTER